MTANKSLKRIIRNRTQMTGMSYSSARAQVLRDRDEIAAAGFSGSAPHFTLPRVTTPNVYPDDIVAGPKAIDVVILKLNQQSARVRVLATGEQITLRSSEVCEYVPGQIVTVNMSKRWVYRGDAYATGDVGNGRVDIPALKLMPIALRDQGIEDSYDAADDFNQETGLIGALWKKVTAKPRPEFEMEPLVMGFDSTASGEDGCPIFTARELRASGETWEAENVLMDALLHDLRCLDAHAHLGIYAFDRCIDEALLHYEVGVRIGAQALEPNFTGLLPWGYLYNRPFLRCLHGYGLVLWRLGKMKEAEHVFERMIWLNPNDNQGARFCWLDVKAGKSWEAASGEPSIEA